MAIHNNFEWFRGEDILITFTQTPVTDISGWTISFKVRTTLGSPTVLLTTAATLLTPLSGIYTVAVSALQNTTTLAAGPYVYSAARTDSGSAAVLSEGSILVKSSAQLA